MAWPTGRGPQPRDPRHRRELLACNERKEERSCTPLTELSVGGPRVHRHKQTVEKTVARYIRNTGVIKKNHHGRLIPFHRESRAPPPPPPPRRAQRFSRWLWNVNRMYTINWGQRAKVPLSFVSPVSLLSCSVENNHNQRLGLLPQRPVWMRVCIYTWRHSMSHLKASIKAEITFLFSSPGSTFKALPVRLQLVKHMLMY